MGITTWQEGLTLNLGSDQWENIARGIPQPVNGNYIARGPIHQPTYIPRAGGMKAELTHREIYCPCIFFYQLGLLLDYSTVYYTQRPLLILMTYEPHGMAALRT